MVKVVADIKPAEESRRWDEDRLVAWHAGTAQHLEDRPYHLVAPAGG